MMKCYSVSINNEEANKEQKYVYKIYAELIFLKGGKVHIIDVIKLKSFGEMVFLTKCFVFISVAFWVTRAIGNFGNVFLLRLIFKNNVKHNLKKKLTIFKSHPLQAVGTSCT